MRGFNGTVFAYGQTGGGKTHTMAALMEHAAGEVFDAIERAPPGREFLLRVSALEIHNETCHDLIVSNGAGTSLGFRV